MKRTDANGAGPSDDTCALVTGAGRGIGAAIATALAEAGWNVAINYSSDEEGARSVAEAVEGAGARAITVQADVADAEAVDGMFGRVEDELGTTVVLVNNAGIRHDRLIGGLDPDDWGRVVGVNMTGAYNTIHRAIGPMVRKRFGRVINVSSISAQQPLPGQSAYAASKAGLEALTRTVAVEVARRGVTVNAIAPGLVDTDFVPDMADAMASGLPAKRMAQPEEIGQCVRFLASEEAAYVTGAVLRIDGGLTAGIPILGRPGKQAATSK
jgi:3-oxoacyl-[acyl-carrier protein] reductase